MNRFGFVLIAVGGMISGIYSAEPSAKLVEVFDAKNIYRVTLKSEISGKIPIPSADPKVPKVVTLSGSSKFEYDERILPAVEGNAQSVLRHYRQFELARTIGDQDQKAGIRESVRRMIVLRSGAGKKAPFSPDGALTFGEIDAVKNDFFSPTLVTGLLPMKEVSIGSKWKASEEAVIDLTDLEKIEEGGLDIEYLSNVQVNGKPHAKLAITGRVKGKNEDGPSLQQLDGAAYFDLEAGRLSYIKLHGVHDLLGENGKPVGKIEGTETLTREVSPKAEEFSDAAIKALGVQPNDENTQLLFDDKELGFRFLYPRRWRVGVVQGKQFTLDEPGGAGVLFTVYTAAKTPSAKAFQDEAKMFLAKQKAKVSPIPDPKRTVEKPKIDRFGLDAEMEYGPARLEYGVLTATEGGLTMAARLPVKLAAELTPDLERILKSFAFTKAVAEK